MTSVETQVMATVNAPYGVNLSAHALAAKIADPQSASTYDASVFAFFSEVSPKIQEAFIVAMGVDIDLAHQTASQFAEMSGYSLPLAA
jgi:hypothetical protein